MSWVWSCKLVEGGTAALVLLCAAAIVDRAAPLTGQRPLGQPRERGEVPAREG